MRLSPQARCVGTEDNASHTCKLPGQQWIKVGAHLQVAAQEALRALSGALIDNAVEPIQAVQLDQIGNLIRPQRSRCARARRIRGCVDAIKAHLAHQCARALKLLLLQENDMG